MKARGERRRVRSDWMELEQKRGISITSTVLQFPYRDRVRQPARHARAPRLLRGHLPGAGRRRRRRHGARRAPRASSPRPASCSRSAATGACRCSPSSTSGTGPSRPPLELLDEIETQLRLDADAGHVAGRVGRGLRRPRRPPRRARSSASPGWPAAPARPARSASSSTRSPTHGGDGEAALEELDLLDAVGHDVDVDELPRRASRRRCSSARRSPTSACACCSTASSTWRRRRRPAPASTATRPPARRPVLGVRVQGAGQHGPVAPRPHRLRAGVLGPLRAGHGRHPRPDRASRSPPSTPTRCSARSGRRSTRPSPATSSASSTPPACGSATRSTPTRPSSSPASRASPPSCSPRSGRATPASSSSSAPGIRQLDEEGVVQVLRDPDLGDQAPMLAAVGQMQFEVAVHRLENEFGAPVELIADVATRWPGSPTRRRRPTLRAMSGVRVLQRADGVAARAVREPVLAGHGSRPTSPSSASTASWPRAWPAESVAVGSTRAAMRRWGRREPARRARRLVGPVRARCASRPSGARGRRPSRSHAAGAARSAPVRVADPGPSGPSVRSPACRPTPPRRRRGGGGRWWSPASSPSAAWSAPGVAADDDDDGVDGGRRRRRRRTTSDDDDHHRARRRGRRRRRRRHRASSVEGLLTFRGSPTRTYYGEGPVPDGARRSLWSYPGESGGMCAESTRRRRDPHVVRHRAGRASRRCSSATAAPGWCSAPTTGPSTSSTARPASDILPPFPTGDIIKGSVTIDPDGFPLVYSGSRDNYVPRHRHRPARADRAVVAVGRRRVADDVEQRLGRLGPRDRRLPASRAARTASSTS